MKIKKLLLPVLVFAFMFVTTVFASATTLTISATKTSGQVETYEQITYTVTTDSTTTGLKSLTVVGKDCSTNKIVIDDAANASTSTIGKLYCTSTIPATPYDNISVTVTAIDYANVTNTVIYSYTMNTVNTYTITANPASGKVTPGQEIVFTEKTSLNGVGIKSTTVNYYDALGNKIEDTQTKYCDDEDLPQGDSVYYLHAYAPNDSYATFKIVVDLVDVRGGSYSKTFNYSMDVATATITHTVLNSAKTATIANNSTVGAKQSVYVRAQSNSTTIGVRKTRIVLTNTTINKVYFDSTSTSQATKGASPYDIGFAFPSDAGNYKLEVTSVDINGGTHSDIFYFTLSSNITVDESNTLTITADQTTGSVLPVNTKVKFSSNSTNLAIGTKTLTVVIKRNGSQVYSKDWQSSYSTGSNPMSYTYAFTQAGSYEANISSIDINGNTAQKTFYYTITDGTTTTNTVSITFDPESGENVEEGDYIRATAKSANSSDIITYITFKMIDADGDIIDEDAKKTSKSTVSWDIEVPDDIETSYFTLKVTATTEGGATNTASAKYYLEDDDDDDDDDDKPGYETEYINPDGEDLAIDLWTVDGERMYELDSTIDFVAYYYNFEKSSKKNVVIEVEIPDGFKVMSKTTEYGSVKVKNDTIIYTIGTVPSKTLRKVNFSLKAYDDDLSETANNIVAVIYSDTDDEEDRSTQRVYIYESGEDGSRKAFITGYTDGTFRADNNITREEVAAMMARAFNYSATSYGKTFSDVKQTSWSYKYVLGCYNNNIIKGYTDGTFRPNNNITVEELYAMTYRAMGISEDEKTLFVPKKYKKTTSWETQYVAGLIRLGLLNDDHMEDLDVDDYATRSEVVYVISRVQFRNTSSFSVGYYLDVNSSYWNAKDIEAASYNYTYTRTSSGKEKVKTEGTYLDTNSNYIK